MHGRRVSDWIAPWRNAVRRDLGSGDVRLLTRRYLPAVFALGVAAGVVLSLLSAGGAVLVVLLAGAGIGYAARSYVSFRRRQKVRERWS